MARRLLRQRQPRFQLADHVRRAKLACANSALNAQIEQSAATIESIGHKLAESGFSGFGGKLIAEAERLRKTINNKD